MVKKPVRGAPSLLCLLRERGERIGLECKR
jgi:hypothetical protein